MDRAAGDHAAEPDVWRHGADSRQRAVIARLDDRPLAHIVDLEQGDHPVLEVRVAVRARRQLDPELQAVAEALEHFLQGLDALAAEAGTAPGPGVEPLQLAHRPGSHRSRPVRGALEPGVVDDHGAAIPRELHVELDRVGPVGGGQLEGGDRVLGGVERCPPVGDHQRGVAGAAAGGWRCRGRHRRGSIEHVRTPVIDVLRPALRLGTRLYFGLRFEGVEHIPQAGPLIIAPNHVTYADPPLVSIPVRRPVYYMAWSQLFQVPGLSWLIRRLRAFPVDIEAADPRATREAVRVLQAGEALMIFPEAGRSPDGRLQRFRPGAFRLACSLGVPVLPVTIIGGHEVWPPGAPCRGPAG